MQTFQSLPTAVQPEAMQICSATISSIPCLHIRRTRPFEPAPPGPSAVNIRTKAHAARAAREGVVLLPLSKLRPSLACARCSSSRRAHAHPSLSTPSLSSARGGASSAAMSERLACDGINEASPNRAHRSIAWDHNRESRCSPPLTIPSPHPTSPHESPNHTIPNISTLLPASPYLYISTSSRHNTINLYTHIYISTSHTPHLYPHIYITIPLHRISSPYHTLHFYAHIYIAIPLHLHISSPYRSLHHSTRMHTSPVHT